MGLMQPQLYPTLENTGLWSDLSHTEEEAVENNFVGMFLNMSLCDVLLMIGLQLWDLGRKITDVEVPFSSHHIRGTWYQHDVTIDGILHHSIKVILAGFLHYVTMFHIYNLWKQISKSIHSGKGGENSLHFLKWGVSTYITRILL